VPDGRHFVSRARDEAASWRSTYKTPITTKDLASRMGGYLQAYTLYSSVRPFGITAIVGGWDSELELPVDGQVGSGPSIGSGGKVEGKKYGGPGLYMIEPSGQYWGYVYFLKSLAFGDIIRIPKFLTHPRGLPRSSRCIRF
jgi:20S proteasome subunit alpha 7